jgi:PAS domain S-box-containing protein
MSANGEETARALRVLLVEDSIDDALLIQRELRKLGGPMVFERVEEVAALEHALESSWDLVVSDWSLPRFSARAALECVQRRNVDAPFIIVSGTIGEEAAVDAMRAGAHDYVSKNNLARLVVAVERELRERTALRTARAKNAAILAASLDGIVAWNAGGHITQFNQAAERMFGVRRAEALGRPLSSFLATASPIAEGRSEHVALGEGGRELPVELAVSRLGADVTGFVAIVRDLSEQKRAEAALHEQVAIAGLGADIGIALTEATSLDELLTQCARAVQRRLEASFVRIWTFNADRSVLEARATEGTRNEVPGLEATIRLGESIVGNMGEIALAKRSYAGPTDEGFLFGHPLVMSGSVIGVLGVLAPKPFSEAMIGALSSIADSIALGVREKETEAAKATLETQVRQRHKLEAVGRLAGGIAHDFNNVLSVIMSYGEFLLDEVPPTGPVHDDVEEIRKAARRAADLTRQLLTFSRQQVLTPRVLDLKETFGAMRRMLDRLLGEDVELVTDLADDLGRVRIDPASFEQLVMNLVVNARDAMPRGGKLTLEMSNVTLDEDFAHRHVDVVPGRHVMMVVSDTGIGMDETTRSRLFEPFFTTKEVGKGTGLGLATVFGIVHQSGGTIWVESELGRGTTFTIYLPRIDAPIDARGQKRPVDRSLHEGNETILLVEDEPQLRRVVLELLGRRGYNVLVAENGERALQLAASEEVDLLLTDVVMPGISGPELAKKIAAVHPNVKVLFVSGYTDDTILRHGMLETSVTFLQKPFTPGSLAEKVRDVLDERSSRA